MNDKCVVLNAKKMNFDGKLDFSVLSSDVTVYDDTTEQQLSERIQGADIIVTKEMPVSAEMIQKFPESVKLICEAGTGYNNIDLEAVRKKGITVCNIPAYSTERVAHTAIMMILNLSSAMQVQMKMLACGNHDNFTRNLQVPHVEVNGKTLGVIGAGHIGRKVIQIAQALDMNILVYTRTPREDEKGIRYVSLEELLKNSDYVSLHCPLTENTKHMINKESLSLMKPSAFIINTSRGALIDEAALSTDIEFIEMMTGEEISEGMLISGDYKTYIEKISPTYLVTESSVPTLLGYGLKDHLVPGKLKYGLVDALDKNEVPYDYLEFPHSNHGMYADLDVLQDFLDLSLDYCNKYFKE